MSRCAPLVDAEKHGAQRGDAQRGAISHDHGSAASLLPYKTLQNKTLPYKTLPYKTLQKQEMMMTKAESSETVPGLAGVLVRIHDKASIGAVLSLYWCLFWILNGFDKFFNADSFFGVNFKMALEGALLPSLNLSTSLAQPIAIIVGVIELVLGLLFLVSLAAFLRNMPHRYEVGSACIGLSVLFFALLSAGAILFGARDPMIQHGVFIGTLLVSGLTLHVSKKATS
ncbi:hypothetical protein [Candidatus Poriferisodalis sp.]|uniref:hypothetical protein n=1 Tax=Candidatus Poriferisodalis sp. TaxID=3101277 RepID=UPI003B01F7E3